MTPMKNAYKDSVGNYRPEDKEKEGPPNREDGLIIQKREIGVAGGRRLGIVCFYMSFD